MITSVPNLLTLSRILVIPALIGTFYLPGKWGHWIGLVLFVAAGITDFLDGWLARRWGEMSRLGRLLDPVADKLLVAAALVTLVALDRLAAWVAVVVIARELAVTWARASAHQTSGAVHAAAWLGKLKTTAQVAMILLLIVLDPAPGWVDAVVWLVVVLTVVSGVDALRTVRAAEPAR